MRRYFTSLLLTAMAINGVAEVPFDDWSDGRTLRLDYVFAGDAQHSAIYLEGLGQTDVWAGRRQNLDKPLLQGNGEVCVTDAATGDTLYVNTFSTLFQEWKTTPEAATVQKTFDATYLVPMPRKAVDVTVSLRNNRHETDATIKHRVDPNDILIRRLPQATAPSKYTLYNGPVQDCIDVIILGEGYTAEEQSKFFADAERATDALFSHQPFQDMKKHFNVLALATESAQSGPSVPHEGLWVDNAFDSHFDTFYSNRYLTTQAIHDIYDAIGHLPAEHLILLVNTPRYGGGGIFNQITLATSDHPTFKQVLVHEFGHAFAGLADEYFYAGEEDETYPIDVEPWEPNITTLIDFGSKWSAMVPEGTPIPTPCTEGVSVNQLDPTDAAQYEMLHALTQRIGVYEGAGYKSKGVYRPVEECRMKVNEVDWFCPVCTRAIENMILWYTVR